MDVDAISTAVREVLTGTLGSVRTVTAGKFEENVHDESSDAEMWLRGRSGTAGALQAQADVRIGTARQTGWAGPPSANITVWVLPLEVGLYYAAQPYGDLVTSRRYLIRAQAAEDAVTVTQALTWPGNLTATAAAAATGIVSGILQPRGEPVVEREEWTDEVGLLVLAIPFDAWIQESQAVA